MPFADFALVQLDRPAVARVPFVISETPVHLGDELSAIGFPFGMAAMRSSHGFVTLDQFERTSFVTNLDVSEGNSGGPVLNRAGEVVGILIGGTPSANTYVDGKLGCQRVNRCDQDGRSCILPDVDNAILRGFQKVGSDVQRIAPIADLLR